jgi:three-Cys-motif partner protein
MPVPKEYEGREQSYLKHEVLKHYLARWGAKLSSIGRGRPVKLWYVDCFAGPWQAKDVELADTSIAIGLRALRAARTTWRDAKVTVGAIFVEPSAASYKKLRQFLDDNSDDIETYAWHGTFGDSVDKINATIAGDPAFLFVDPTGWKGLAMKYVAPLVGSPRRDVLVNFMTNDLLRFHNDPREFLRAQMQELFGHADDAAIPRLSEEGLVDYFCSRLKQVCGLKFAADLAVPHPTHERTKFRLVIGGHDKEVIRVFREAEELVIGGLAAEVREDAKRRGREKQSGALEFVFDPPSEIDKRYKAQRAKDEEAAVKAVLAALNVGPRRFADVWPGVLERHHLSVRALAGVVDSLRKQGIVVVDGWGARQDVIKDKQVVRLGDSPADV